MPLKAILMIGIFAVLEVGCARAANAHSPSGQMVDIGGCKLHIHCTGEGAPTVIVENGGAAFSFDWELVQPEVEKFTRICTYNRAGYAWSDVGPEFDTFDRSVHDLHILPSKAGIAGPYVMVGHSFGGLLVLNASRKAGLVVTVSAPRVDGIECCLAVLRPKGNQTPSHDGQLTLACLAVQPDDRLHGLRCNIERRREVRIIKHTCVVRLHPLGDPLLVCPSSVSTPHGMIRLHS
jgi:pimeloyl-ACP methyl ester carboxylesterase